MLVDCSSLCCRQLGLILGLVFDLLNLLTLLRWGSDFHAENNVTNLGLGQGGNVYIVLLAIIG